MHISENAFKVVALGLGASLLVFAISIALLLLAPFVLSIFTKAELGPVTWGVDLGKYVIYVSLPVSGLAFLVVVFVAARRIAQ